MNFPIFIFLFCIFVINIYIFNGSVLIGDDIYFNFLYNGINLNKNFYYGTFLMPLQNFLLFFLPDFFNINIQDWALSFGVLFKSLIVTIIIFMYTKFLKLENLNNKIVISLAIISYFSIFICFKGLKFIDFIIYEGFFRFIIPLLLLIIFFYYVYKTYFKSNSKIDVIYLYIAAFLTSYSSPIASFIAVSTYILNSIYLLFCKKYKLNNTITLIMLILGTVVLVSSLGFQSHFENKIKENVLTLDYIVKLIPEFVRYYAVNILYKYGIYYILLIALIIINIKKRVEAYKIFFAVNIIAGINLFLFSLIVLGKTSFEQTFWITHRDIHSIIIPLYILSMIIMVSNIKILKEKILIIICIIMMINFNHSAEYLKNSLESIKNHSYMRDKIRVYYIYREQDGIMPAFSKFDSFFNLIQERKTEIGYNKYENEKETGNQHYEKLETNYYNNVYKIGNKKRNKIEIAENDEIAIKEYERNGGRLDEIKTGRYKFSNLSNKEYVLKQKGEENE